MKVQLGVRLTPLANHLNIEFAPQPNDRDRIAGDPYQLDQFIDPNEVTLLLCNSSLDYLPLPAREKALRHWLTRIAHGGVVVIEGIDPYESCRLIYQGQLDLSQANGILYGIGRKSFVRPQDTVAIAESTGQFTVDSVKYNGFTYVITLVRK